jgi:hypothetical protein
MFKNNECFVVEETNDFLRDLFNSKKRLKFFTKFEKSEHSHESKEIEIEIPKKKFISKVKSFQKSDSKNNSKTIF